MQQQQQQQQQAPGGADGAAPAAGDSSISISISSSSPHARTTTTTTLLDLPDAALEAVLRRLPPLQSRLLAGATCMRLHTAAAEVVDTIVSFYLERQEELESLLLYLERHGQHVTRLYFRGDYAPGFKLQLRSLPASCSSLRELTLWHADVQLGADSGAPGVLHAASALTNLDVSINWGELETVVSLAAAVAKLTTLQDLDLWSPKDDESVHDLSSEDVLPGSMLAPLTRLTALRLHSCLGDRTLEHLSCLSGSLRRLQLECGSFAAPLSTVQHLRHLTSLRLNALFPCPVMSLPGLSRLSGLQVLEVEVCDDLDPQSLAGCSRLRRLALECTPVAGGPDGVAALLGHLRACTQLTCLQLEEALQDEPPSPSAYAALTASSSLEVLRVHGKKDDAQLTLPISAWRAMFGGSNKLLPRLRELKVGVWPDLQPDADAAEEAAGLTAADMQALVRCCPGLQDLCLFGSTGMPHAGLVPLTALTQLTSLCIYSDSFSAALGGDFEVVVFEAAAGAPSVVAQLQERLARADWRER